MHEILDHLPPRARVLDLGCNFGSFNSAAFRFTTIRADLIAQDPGSATNFVQADAARLPFRSRAFDAVICNHGLEHFVELKYSLQEIGRVLRREGSLFVSVPKATSLQDRVYRKLTNGGGHVNLFDRPEKLADMLAWYSGLPHVATKVLYASFVYLNRRNVKGVIPKRLSLLSWHWELPLSLLTYFTRAVDTHLNTSLSVYGWAMYFGTVPERVDLQPWTNVCIRCGQAHPSHWLRSIGAVHRKWSLFSVYLCPGCGASNFYSDDEHFAAGR
jgi:SAM-dependent methyltransferase